MNDEFFAPFQIETVKARCILEELIYTSKTALKDGNFVISQISEAHRRLLKYYDHPDNNVLYVFKVANQYETIYDMYSASLTPDQISQFTQKVKEILRKMDEHLASPECRRADMIKPWQDKLRSCLRKN